MKISSSISSLGFTFSLFLFLQSLFSLAVSSPQRRLLQISSQPLQKNPQFFPSTAIPAFINTHLPPPPPPPVPNPTYSDNDNLTTAIVSTAASSFALSGFVFFALYRFNAKKTRTKPGSAAKTSGVDLLYWHRRCFNCLREDDEVLQRRQGVLDQKAQETPLLFSNSANSSSGVLAPSRASPENSVTQLIPPAEKPPVISQSPPPPPTVALPKPPIPPPVIKSPAPPLPPPPPAAAPQPPIPMLLKKSQAPPPPPPRHRPNEANDRPRLKPLHWEKMIPTGGGRSMVWDRLNDGSIKFDEDQMEALFAANLNPPKSSGHPAAAAIGTQISLLDGRKSQNAAIILRMVAASRQEIIDGLRHGSGLAADTLEKLARIAPTKDEESLILSFAGDPAHLPHAESFLFSLLQAIPSAFPRISAMHFCSSVYEQETLHLKQCLATLELACKELRTGGLLLKLLETVLKAGNRMNAGTAMGNARAFDLAALRKLSGFKSADGSTSLLHFVVEAVVRSEGKRCSGIAGRGVPPEEREWEYVMLGLPVVGGLSAEFANVKAAATTDFNSLAGACTALADRVADVRQLLRGCGERDEGFAREMEDFAGVAEREMEELREEQWRVMEMVRRTTEYYQPGAAAREKEGKPPLQLFAIVSDFLAMVDQACVDIARNAQKMKKKQAAVPLPKEKRIAAAFSNLPAALFMAENIAASRSESGEEF